MRQVRFGVLGQALKVAGLANALAIDLLDHVAALEAEIAGIGAVIDVDDDDALIGILQLQFVGERRRKIGDLDARKRRARADHDLIARRFRRGLQRDRHRLFAPAPAAMPSLALPPSGLVAKR